MRIKLGDTSVVLLAEHAVFLEESSVLVVSDVHLGKSATFRERGIPIPEGDTADDLEKLTKLVCRYEPRRIVIAGDLVHAKGGMSPYVLEVFRKWEKEISIPITLTEGNHDRMARISEHELAIEMAPWLDIDGVRITHDPAELPEGQPGIAGHLHPGVRLSESPRRSIRTAFFFLRHPHHLVLPAFSQFTGLNLQRPQTKDRVFIPLRQDVVEVPM